MKLSLCNRVALAPLCGIFLISFVVHSSAHVPLETSSEYFEDDPVSNKLREMLFRDEYMAPMKREMETAEEVPSYGRLIKNPSNFANPFVFKRDEEEVEERSKEGKGTQRLFFRNPFILKRDEYQKQPPSIPKQNRFQHPFVFKREEQSEDVNNNSGKMEVGNRLYRLPTIFKRLVELQNAAAENRDDLLY